MDNLKWRKMAKFVAYFDLITASLGLSCAFLLAGFTLSDITDPKIREIIISNNKIYKFWIFIAIGITECLLLIWGARKLLRATDSGSDPGEASKMSKIWRIITIVLFVKDVLCLMVTGEYTIAILIWLVIRGIFLWIVSKFIFELERALNPIPNLAQVTVKM